MRKDFEGLFEIGAKLVRREGSEKPVRVAVSGDFVSAAFDFADQIGIAFSHPAEHEKRCFHFVLREQVQQQQRVALHARFAFFPLIARNDAVQILNAEPVFEVDGEDVRGGRHSTLSVSKKEKPRC